MNSKYTRLGDRTALQMTSTPLVAEEACVQAEWFGVCAISASATQKTYYFYWAVGSLTRKEPFSQLTPVWKAKKYFVCLRKEAFDNSVPVLLFRMASECESRFELAVVLLGGQCYIDGNLRLK